MKIQMTRSPLWTLLGLLACVSTHAQGVQQAALGQNIGVLRSTELRSDKLAAATVLQNLPAGATLRWLGLEGGWAQVQTQDPSGMTRTGWVRASAVNLSAEPSAAASLTNGRLASGNAVLTLGVRGMPSRANRHALIIGVGRYADPATPPLPGTKIDKQSATQMAQAMQVPLGNISYLQDEQATGGNIRQALRDLSDKVQDGDRVFIHFSGHGTRYNDPAVGGCVEALLAYEGGQSGVITNREMANLLKTITQKTDKLFVMYDACHSGGVVQTASSVRTRGFANANDDGLLRPKFANISEECGRPVNVKTRSLLVETGSAGMLPQDIIHVSASRDNEISFDDEQKGGLATQYVRDCMLREAKDTDNSGALSMNEIRQCAQTKIDQRMANDPNYKAHHLMLNGNAAFVPAWFSQPSATATVPIPVAAPVKMPPAKPPAVVAEPAPLSGEQALRQMFDQRDAKRRVQVTMGKSSLKIGQDALDLAVQTDRAGYVYVALAGSDNQSVYLLFPNDQDQDNKIEAGQQLLLPRPSWQVKAGGPAGTDNLLVMVSDAPRDLRALAQNKSGPFVKALNDARGRAQLGALMTASQSGGSPACAQAAKRRQNALCSDAYGAAMVAVEETH
jgi:hypothetical protein